MNNPSLLMDGINDAVNVLGPIRNQIKSNRKAIRSLIHMFDGVEDFRQPLKIIYSLDDILCICLILAMKGKFTSFVYAADYIRFKAKYFRKLNLIHGNNIPSHDTLRRIFMYIDANELRDIILFKIKNLLNKIVEFANSKSKAQPKIRLLSGDGKTFNGSGRKGGARNVNVFNVLDASSCCCLTSIPLSDKDSEIPAFQNILSKMNLQNTMVTADALHCQRKTFEIVGKKGGLITVKVKDNQAAFKEHIIDMLELNKGKVKKFSYNSCEYEILHIDWEPNEQDFPYAKSYVRMISHKRIHQADYNPEPQYFASISDSAQLIMEAIDNRWHIESDFHWFKDIYLGEDECTFTDKNAIKVMATFNNIVYALIKVAKAILGNEEGKFTRMRFEEETEEILLKIIPLLEGQNLSNLLKENMRGAKKKNI